MPPNKLFDDILRILQAAVVYTGVTQVSLEVDFEIPRGYVVKIRAIELRVDRIHEDLENFSVDRVVRYRIALIKDPDDTTSLAHGSNRTEHDVLADLEVSVLTVAGTAGDPGTLIEVNSKLINFEEMKVDVITARNMRLNVDAEGTDATLATEAFGIAIIYYTLEEVKDDDIINLLDIL